MRDAVAPIAQEAAREGFDHFGGCCLASSLGGAANAAKIHTMPVQAFLCDTAEHAIAFANALASGDGEEVAKDRVGRLAKGEVCGRWVGVAAIESEAVTLQGGLAYKITAYRFTEDGKRAWRADATFAPVGSGWDL